MVSLFIAMVGVSRHSHIHRLAVSCTYLYSVIDCSPPPKWLRCTCVLHFLDPFHLLLAQAGHSREDDEVSGRIQQCTLIYCQSESVTSSPFLSLLSLPLPFLHFPSPTLCFSHTPALPSPSPSYLPCGQNSLLGVCFRMTASIR